MKKTLLLCLPLLLAACGPSFEQLAETRSSEVRPKLKQIETVGRAAQTFDKEIKDIALPEGVKLKFIGKSSEPNAALLQAETFNEDVSKRTPPLDLIIDDSWLEHLNDAYAAPPNELPVEYFTTLCDQLAALRYLVVVRTRSHVDPWADGESTFSPGSWQAEVMVFEIADGKFLGGGTVTATNADTVNVDLNEANKWLHSDLWERARKAVDAAVAPSSEAPPLG